MFELIKLESRLWLSLILASSQGGDSGELVAEACHLGVAHPPGYPLFVLLGHLAIKLPLPEAWLNSQTPAYRVNLMNATFGAFTGWFMFRCVVKMCGLLTQDKPHASSMLLKAATIAAGLIASVRQCVHTACD